MAHTASLQWDSASDPDYSGDGEDNVAGGGSDSSAESGGGVEGG